MQGVISVSIGGVVLPNDNAAAPPSLLWTIAGTTQITEEAASAVYTVSHAGDGLASGETVTIDVDTADGTASNGVDYTGVATTLTFTEGGATQKTLAVTIVEDTIVEGTEDYRIALSAPSRGSLAASQVNTLIVDEDATSLVWSIAGSTEIDEGDPGSYTVSYTGVTLAPGQIATITVASADGTADAASDYTALATVLTFTGGGATQKTVAVSTIDDTDVEGTEDFRITISGQSIGTLNTSQVDTDIVDDDEAPSTFTVDAVTFDGTNDYLTRDGGLTGATDNRKGWGQIWYRKTGSPVTNEAFSELEGTNLQFFHHSFGSPSNVIVVTVKNSSGALTFSIRATVGMRSDGAWHHLAWYVDTDAAAGAKVGYIYEDGVDRTGVKTDAGVAFDIDWTRSDLVIGAQANLNGKFVGDIAEYIFAPGQDFDISNPANLAKLRNAGTGKPVDVGATGATPSGVAPLVYLHLDNGETPADNFAINAGGGGGMTVNGALAVAASSPTD